MKFIRPIVLVAMLVSLIIFGCTPQGGPDENNTNQIPAPEDVFPQEILTQIRFPYIIGANELEITYIGNHGFLFSTLSKRILIDSLTEIGGGYETTSRVILSMLNEAGFPFNNIELALTTHSHGDHFEADRVIEFLLANPQATHLTTEEAETTLQGATSFAQIASQSLGVTPDPNTRYRIEVAGMAVEVIRLDHHGVENYDHVAFMFTLNGIKVLHIGDACKIPAQYEGLNLERENIDILIAPFGSSCANWTVVGFEDDDPFEIINRFIRPKHIIVSHLDFESTAADVQAIINTLSDRLPGITFSAFHPVILKQKIYVKEGNRIRVIDKPTS